MNSPRRRTVLTVLSATTLSAVAGCTELLGSDSDDDRTGEVEQSGDDESNETGTDESEPAVSETVEEGAHLFGADLASGRIDDAFERIALDTRDELPPGLIEQSWLGLSAVGGEFQEIVETEVAVDGDVDAVDVTVAFERVEDVVRVLVDDEFAVVGYAFSGTYERPTYVDTDAFDDRSTTLDPDGCSVSASIAVPDDADDVPGAVLVHGSGPSNKDVELTATRMFTDVAEGLATRGVATLRYDKRTYTCPVDPADHTLDHVTVDDALVAIDDLRDVSGVDGDRIVVVGLSMGGMAAPRIADRDGNLAGAVAMAAPARPFHDISVDQQAHLATVGDYEWDAQTEAYDRWSERMERVRDGDYELDDDVLGYPGALWNSLDAYDHVGTARDVDVPFLFLQGDRDYQVTTKDDFELWEAELDGRPDTSFELYDGLNHVFMPGEGPSVPSEYHVRNNVDERVIDDVADWITGL